MHRFEFCCLEIISYELLFKCLTATQNYFDVLLMQHILRKVRLDAGGNSNASNNSIGTPLAKPSNCIE